MKYNVGDYVFIPNLGEMGQIISALASYVNPYEVRVLPSGRVCYLGEKDIRYIHPELDHQIIPDPTLLDWLDSI